MRLDGSGGHLTYCSNIHPGESWAEVRGNLERHFTAVRDRVAPGSRFGVGLRLSALAARELADPHALAEFRAFLAANQLYVFTINGFPYGTFHGARVKEDVYLPDWRDPERLRYTDALADLLSQMLPDDVEGSISTVPGAYKSVLSDGAEVERMAEHLLRHVAHLVAIRNRTGRSIVLALEPEPCCFLETVAETVGFFRRHLFSAQAVRLLGELAGLDRASAAAALHAHLGVCLDLCHAAVEFEDPAGCLRELREAGIRVAKLQISAGLRLPELSRESMAELHAFEDPVYLHQVVESSEQGLRRYTDLPQAFASLAEQSRQAEWRVHFHVPIFLERMGAFSSTQAFIRSVLQQHRQAPVSGHLEVETYTWGVLPDAFKAGSVDDAVARELRWVVQQLAPTEAAAPRQAAPAPEVSVHK